MNTTREQSRDPEHIDSMEQQPLTKNELQYVCETITDIVGKHGSSPATIPSEWRAVDDDGVPLNVRPRPYSPFFCIVVSRLGIERTKGLSDSELAYTLLRNHYNALTHAERMLVIDELDTEDARRLLTEFKSASEGKQEGAALKRLGDVMSFVRDGVEKVRVEAIDMLRVTSKWLSRE